MCTRPLPSSPIVVLQVTLALAFMASSPVVSRALRLHIFASLMIAALHCMAQLTVIAIVLQHVLASKSVWTVTGITRTFFDNVFTSMSFLTHLASVIECASHVRNR